MSGQKEIPSQGHPPEELALHERVDAPERYRLTEAVAIVLYHRPGVGGSTLAMGVAEALGVADEYYYDGGRDLRDQTGNTPAQTEFMPRPESADKDIDQKQINLFSIATPDKPVVINAKLAAFNAWRFMRVNPGVKIITVLVTCDAEVAKRRIRKRKFEEIDERFRTLSRAVEAEEISNEDFSDFLEILNEEEEENTLKNIKESTQDRIAKDMKQFSEIYPDLKGIKNLYLPEPTVITGEKDDPRTGEKTPTREKLFRYQVSTTHKNQKQALRALLDELEKDGEIEKVPNAQDANNSEPTNTRISAPMTQ